MKHMWRQVFCFCVSKGCTSQHRIQTSRWFTKETLQIVCAGGASVLRSVTPYCRSALNDFFHYSDNCQISLKGKNQWRWFFMTWRMIAAIQKKKKKEKSSPTQLLDRTFCAINSTFPRESKVSHRKFWNILPFFKIYFEIHLWYL